MERIVLATGNAGKIREFEQAFSHMTISCVPVLLKARYYS